MDYKSKLIREQSELQVRLDYTTYFINGAEFKSLDTAQQILLERQIPVMTQYNNILKDRLLLLED